MSDIGNNSDATEPLRNDDDDEFNFHERSNVWGVIHQVSPLCSILLHSDSQHLSFDLDIPDIRCIIDDDSGRSKCGFHSNFPTTNTQRNGSTLHGR